MKFSKWTGLGNDFIFPEPGEVCSGGRARELCDRRFGIGADGLVLITPLGGRDFQMRIFNSDGSEAEMCGNATRCAALYIARRKLADGTTFRLHTRAGIVSPHINPDGTVTVDMGRPRLRRGEIPMTGDPDARAVAIPLAAAGKTFVGTAVSMGNPHFVIFVDDMENIALTADGPAVEHASEFPKKTNVEFAQILAPGKIRMRVWERGCGVTMACGTGSCATLVAAQLTGRAGEEVEILLDGGPLHIQHAEDGPVLMTGPAKEVYRGETA